MRLWFFRAVTLLVLPMLFLLLLEGALRLAGYGHSMDFVLPCEAEGVPSYCSNEYFSQLFFPEAMARPPQPFAFPREKPESTRRIVVLGGSAAQGDPYVAAGFSRILEVMLAESYPETNFEVINAAFTAINSHVVYRIAREMARHEPDVFIIYMGNNEVVGPYGSGTVFTTVAPPLGLIRIGTEVKSTRTGQLLQYAWRALAPGEEQSQAWGGMQMFLGSQVRAEDPNMRRVYENFARNLRHILRIARGREIPVILSTVGTNIRDSAPFASLHGSDVSALVIAQWEKHYRSALGLARAGRCGDAFEGLEAAARLDHRYAGLHFLRARCLDEEGMHEQARESFIRARDLDTLRFRADTRINAIIRDVGSESNGEEVRLVDAVDVFEKASPWGSPGGESFWEHVHMNFSGNYLLAGAVMEGLDNVLHLSGDGEPPGRPLPSEAKCMELTPYTDVDRLKVYDEMLKRLTRPPFTNRMDNERWIANYKKELQEIWDRIRTNGLTESERIYEHTLESGESAPSLYFNYAIVLQASDKHTEAVEQLRNYIRKIPHHPAAYERLADSLYRLGSTEEAVSALEEALRISPDFHDAHAALGRIFLEQGAYGKAETHLRRAVELEPGEPSGHFLLVEALEAQGNYGEAFRMAGEGVEALRRASREDAASELERRALRPDDTRR